MSYNPNNPNGQATMANSAPMVVASNQSAIPVSFTGSTDVATQTTLAALNTKVTAVNTGAVVVSSSALPSGAATLAEQQTQTTALQLIDDIVYTDDTSTHATGTSKGVGIMAAATPTDAAVTANDIGMVAMTTDRKLHVSIQDALPAGTAAIGKLAANSGVDIGDVDVLSIAAGTNAIGNVGMTPRTSGGLLIKNCTSGDGSTALTSTAQAIKASAGQLFGWYIFNPNTVTAWVIIYNTAAASVTVGTTAPVLVLGIPAGAAANVVNPMGIEFTNAGWSAAAVMTSAAGTTAPTTALDANFFYI